jgi:hypothetical protein
MMAIDNEEADSEHVQKFFAKSGPFPGSLLANDRANCGIKLSLTRFSA